MLRLPAIVFILCSLSACAENLSHNFSPPSRFSDRDVFKGCLLVYRVCADRDMLTSGSDASCLSVFFSCLFESVQVGRHQRKRGSWNKRADETENPDRLNARKTPTLAKTFPQDESLDVVREEEVHELFQMQPAKYDVGMRGREIMRNNIDEMSQSFRRNRGGNLQTNNQPIEVIETAIETVFVGKGKKRGGDMDHIMKRLVSNDAKDSKPMKMKDNKVKQRRNVDYEGATNEPIENGESSKQPIRNEDTTSQPITEEKRGSWNKRSNGLEKRQGKTDVKEEMINTEHGKLRNLERRGSWNKRSNNCKDCGLNGSSI
ncbi:hypothetical protein V1264_009262 [Littorina saxatilis]|uniref:Uncharacterized protein n=1 Tax=Littorina saxatilis TaxID=31220 RepID=A0AAN9AR58_9CAEN